MKKQFEAFGSPQNGVIEECSEVIKAICKAERFGYRNYHPDTPRICNADEILSELDDLQIRINEFRPLLNALSMQFKQGY